jgi:hypothetical protein
MGGKRAIRIKMILSMTKLTALIVATACVFVFGQPLWAAPAAPQGSCHGHAQGPTIPKSDTHRCCISAHHAAFLVTAPPNAISMHKSAAASSPEGAVEFDASRRPNPEICFRPPPSNSPLRV